MNGKLRVEGQSGYGSFQEKACSRETCSTYSSSSHIGNIHRKNLFFKGYGEIDIRVSNSYFDGKFRARLNAEIVGSKCLLFHPHDSVLALDLYDVARTLTPTRLIGLSMT